MTRYYIGKDGFLRGTEFYCAKCGPTQENVEEHDGEGHDWADLDFAGYSRAECEACGEYVFPDEVAELEAEERYMYYLYKSGQLGQMVGRDNTDEHAMVEEEQRQQADIARKLLKEG